jgi:hypothetical protein
MVLRFCANVIICFFLIYITIKSENKNYLSPTGKETNHRYTLEESESAINPINNDAEGINNHPIS